METIERPFYEWRFDQLKKSEIDELKWNVFKVLACLLALSGLVFAFVKTLKRGTGDQKGPVSLELF